MTKGLTIAVIWRFLLYFQGKQQCMDGLDEDYCERLEFNECEDDEYWLDGDFACMDWTDEKDTLVNTGNTCLNSPSFVCDEHLCPYNQWSCGDGKISGSLDRNLLMHHCIFL